MSNCIEVSKSVADIGQMMKIKMEKKLCKNKTFKIIKPDAIENKYTGKIIDRILSENFNIIEARLIKMNKNQAEEFYGIHKERPFFNDLVSYMYSGQSMVLWLEKDNAVSE